MQNMKYDPRMPHMPQYTAWHMWVIFHSYGGHVERECVRYSTRERCVWLDSFILGTWLIRMRDTTYSYVGHDIFICGTCREGVCELQWCVIWRVYTWDATHTHMRHDVFICGYGAATISGLIKITGLFLQKSPIR